MASHKKELAGVISAPLIPLSEKGKLDLATLQKQISYLIESGINGLFVNGTTGEGAYLTLEEKLAILRTVKEVAAGRVFLCAEDRARFRGSGFPVLLFPAPGCNPSPFPRDRPPLVRAPHCIQHSAMHP